MRTPGDQKFNFELRLKRFEPIALLVAPAVQIPEDAVMTGRFSKEDNTAVFTAHAPVIQYGKVRINNFIIDETTDPESLSILMTADRIDFTNSLYIKNINFSNILSHDSSRFNLKLSDVDATNQLDLNGLLEFRQQDATRLSLLPSDIVINREAWKLEEKVQFGFEKGKTRINGFELSRDKQLVKLDGVVSSNNEDHFDLNFSDFQVSTFSALTRHLGIALKGKLDGEIGITSLLNDPYIIADIHASDIYYNNTAIGDMSFRADLDQATGIVDVDLHIENNEHAALSITGTYDVLHADRGLDLDVNMEEVQLVIFQPFLRKLVSNITGTASARLTMMGSPVNPNVNGIYELNQAGMVVNYLKTPYNIDGSFTIKQSAILLNEHNILDRNNNRAIATGAVNLANLRNPDVDVKVTTDKFMVLNTIFIDNPLYYGAVYGTGDFIFKGPTNNMNINIAASTNEGTVLNIPLNAAGTVADNDFITFVLHDSAGVQQPKVSYFEGLTLNLDLTVNPNAEANIYTDLGKLSGRGNGSLALNITSLGDFEMYGDYMISKGKFEFTAQDFINKIFEISPGGTIRWTGRPTEGLINLKAIYEQRTSVQPLYTAAGRPEGAQRATAQAEMNLTGNLLRPDISFGLNFPQDSYIKDELQSYLSDANNVNQQALSLIVRRSFSPGTGTNLNTELNTTVLGAGTELAFNQLNNIISQSLNLNFVDFNIRSLNEASASIRLLNDRLIFTGGIVDRRSQLNDLNLLGNWQPMPSCFTLSGRMVT